MKYELNGAKYNVEIIKKNNKNTYIRVKDGNIYVTTNFFVTKHQIRALLDNNTTYLTKMLNKSLKRLEDDSFHYLGKQYNIIIVPTMDIEFSGNNIFVKSKEYLNKYVNKQMINLFKERLDIIYNLFEEDIPYPNLKIRKMKTRWGVCNKKNNNVTLNSELMKYDIEEIDYVITHELSHFVHFDHSIYFWNTVAKYCPEYKRIRKVLKDV